MIIVKNRELLIPNNERYIGTTYDDETENRVFQVPRFSQRGVDLAALTFRLDIQYANESYDTVILDKEVGEAFIILIWKITSATLQVPGTLYIGIRAVDSEVTVKWSSFSAAMYAERHLNTPGNYTGGLTEIEQMEQDHVYMKGVVDELKSHLDYTHEAEAWAIGKKDGEDVPSTDETYHNNSKYYSEQASAKATQAANSATAAANSATQAAETVSDTNTRFNNALAAVTSETEVIDARVGADGTQYAVLKNRLDAEHTQLKNAISEGANLTALSKTQGAYIANSGSSTNVTSPVTNANYSYTVVECAEGDTFVINATGGNTARPFSFVKSDGTTLYRCGQGTLNNFEVKAPKDSAYLVINDSSGSTSYKGVTATKEAQEAQGKIDTLSDYEGIPLGERNRYKINIASKTITSGGVIECLAPVHVKPGQTIRFKASALGGAAEYAFGYSTDYTFENTVISSVYPDTSVALGNSHGGEYTVTIPDGVNTLLVSRYATYNADIGVAYFLKTYLENANQFEEPLNQDDFALGGINLSTGQNNGDSTRYNSVGYIDPNIVRIISETYPIFVFAYDANDNYIGWYRNNFANIPSDNAVAYTAYDFSLANGAYKYRIAIVRNDASLSDILPTIKAYVDIKNKVAEIEEKISTFQAEEETELYLTADDTISTVPTAEDVWGLYDALMVANPNYVYKNTLTQGTLTNYEYVFDSHAYNYQSASRPKFAATAKPEILITTGVHGNEPVAVMAAYGFFKALCEDKKAVSKLRQSFVFRIIPVAVPWGFTNRKRWNENGVNINRNFDAGWVAPSESAEPYTNSYQGTSAASELETQLLQAWLQAHTDAAIYIDYHNSGYTSEVSYLSLSQDLTGFATLQDGFRYGENQVIGYWRNSRQMIADTLIYAYTGHISLNGNSERYGDQVGIPSMTLETSDNQNASGANSRYTIGVGIEAFAAMIHGFADHHFKI